jgi:hypothetical protein
MKIKLFGIPIFEYQPSEASLKAGFIPPAMQPVIRASLVPPKPTKLQLTPNGGSGIPNQKSLDDLANDPASSLPAHKVRRKMRLNIEAALDLYGITNPNDLWRHEFKPGSAGRRLRAALGAIGYGPNSNSTSSSAEPAPLTASQLSDRDNLPSAILPRRPNGKLDVAAALKLLEISNPDELWRQQTKFGTALHLLKQTIGSQKCHRPRRDLSATKEQK